MLYSSLEPHILHSANINCKSKGRITKFSFTYHVDKIIVYQTLGANEYNWQNNKMDKIDGIC